MIKTDELITECKECPYFMGSDCIYPSDKEGHTCLTDKLKSELKERK